MTGQASVAIAGYGDAYASAENVKSPIQLGVEATIKALEDANLDRSDVDAVLTGRRPVADYRPQWNNIFASHLNIPTKLSTEVTNHAAGTNGTIKYALAAIEAGLVDTVLCVHSDAAELFLDTGSFVAEMDADEEFEFPYGPWMPSYYGMIAERYLHETETTKEQMARVAVELREWGRRHPKAAMSGAGPLTVDDVLSSQPVCSPLKLLDMAMWHPGGTGGALVITSADRAEALQSDPVYVNGVGEYNTHERLTERRQLTDRDPGPEISKTGAGEAARQAYERSGTGPEEMDVVMSAANFTFIGLMMLEELGFCDRGRAGEFVESGGIDFNDGLAYNTNGGMLNFGEPGVNINMDEILEAVRQLRGEALGVQVDGAKDALIRSPGGTQACHSVAILGTEPRGGP